ncbi:LOW QUALITY PROTEIN: putative disease resistance protein At4g19050 [Juglans microcarpa x Juglans regia]|uniref:LOW QUALITY PROTEIN: putative disease resistance protein At4g19050 n=1 Tax=Juglans microcarpa x Juglans regia TaxID=2249226 RepID=UPI001B7DEC69|nr:LOW QUALITY PROTEIN: putative disease resistance protein At4g19050 [Juglans microcarpa x Juglans regia]
MEPKATASMTMQQEQQFKKIVNLLEDKKAKSTIALVGNAGVGKTWMASEIKDYYINESINGSCFYGTLWFSMNKKYDERSLYEVIARQLSVHSSLEENEGNVENKMTEKETLKGLENKITEKLMEMIDEKFGGDRTSEDKAFLLLILDDVCCESYEEETVSKLEKLLPKEPKTALKFLVTRRNKARSNETENEEVIEIKPLSNEESGTLLKKLIRISVPNKEGFGESIGNIAEKSKGLPAAVVKLVAESLNQSGEHDSGLLKLESALKEAGSYEELDKCIRPLLCYAIDMLQGGGTDAVEALVNCYWHSWEFFSAHVHGAIDYNELILSWILEGYFGSADHVKEAYEEGYRVLMKLIERGVMKMQEGKLVMMEELVLTVPDCRRVGYEQRSILGLARVLDESIWEGFRKVAPSDDMIMTPRIHPRQSNVSTLIIHGSRLSGAEPETFFKPMQGLQNLAIINPRFKSLPPSLSEIEKLQMLVLRGCDQLQNIDDIQQLKSLIVLEISDACFLENIRDDLFEQMTNLRSLNFCGVSIKTLPSSLSKLSQLHWLILRGCSFLESLPSLKAHSNLEVLDLSGSTSLLKITDKTFSYLKKLHFLDFSHTSIKRLPILGKLENLTRLLLRGCKLTRLPSFKALSALQYLELSGSNMLKEIGGDFSENKDKLLILDLSKTEIKCLPSNFGNFPNLKLLNLSDASKLVEIPERAFKEMVCLSHLNLSNTKLEHLPHISILVNLRQLFLKGCPLQEFPRMEGGFQDLVLDLSETAITSLSLNNLGSLRELKLRGCSKLEQLQHLESLVHLEVLDFRETGINKFPHEIYELTQLKHLDLPKGIQELDLRKMKHLPEELNWDECGISEVGKHALHIG